MNIRKAIYETRAGLPALRIKFADNKPDGIIAIEDAYRWAYRGWKGVYIGAAMDTVIPPATIDGKQLPGVSTEPNVIKLAIGFHADLEADTWEEKELDLDAALSRE